MNPPANKQQSNFTIIGAGLGGAVMGNYLARAGYTVDVYEKRLDPRSGKIARGRSINLALSTRGMYALGEIGVLDEVMREAIPMYGRMIHDLSGRLSFQPYGKQNQAINSVSRGGLNQILIEAAEKYPNVSVHFNQRCEDVDLDCATVTLVHNETGERTTVHSDTVIGADGAFSAVRAKLQRLDRFDYSQDYLEHGYKELTIPPADGGGWRMEKNALHIWPRRSYMMIALPNADGSYTVTCFWPFSGPNGFENLETEADVIRYFEAHFPDAVPLMPTLGRDYFENPTSSLVTVRCGPWHYKDKAVLLGDAAHAVVPFYGQGMNAAFEDCTVLNECLRKYCTRGGTRRDSRTSERRGTRTSEEGRSGKDSGTSETPDWGGAFEEYYRLRNENADALADLALENFIEMRDHTGSRSFLIKKKAEKTLHALLPNWYLPLYSMVTFSRIPYAEARRRARAQHRTLRRIGFAAAALAGLIFLLGWTL